MSRLDRFLTPMGLPGVSSSRTYRAMRDPAWTFSDAGQQSRRKMRELHNSQTGASGFIIGTGPSLQSVDFSKVRGHPSIGLNRLFLGFEEFDFVPDFLVCVNLLMLEQSAGILEQLPCRKVVSWNARSHFSGREDVIFLRTTADTDFSKRLMDCVSTGATVTYVALQLAYWLGWSEVTLLGIDHAYALEDHENLAAPHDMVRRIGADSNHFHNAYMPAGHDWQLPDLRRSELAYGEARRVFDDSGRTIRDATIGGKLKVFERSAVNYARRVPHLRSV